jgi:DNA-directed RNA polymerase subunit RPC12/RpoP
MASVAGARTYRCAGCGYPLTLLEGDEAPECPDCGSRRFEPASMFIDDTIESLRPLPAPGGRPGWLDELPAAPLRPGPHVAFEQDGRAHVLAVPPGFMRVGRSLAAHLRIDDPTVSRRHAILHREGGTVTVLEDRSLNGVFVNGEPVSWRRLEHGDEIQIGGVRLYFVEL